MKSSLHILLNLCSCCNCHHRYIQIAILMFFVYPNLHPSYYIQVHYLRVMTKREQGASQEICWGISGKAVSAQFHCAHLEDVVAACPVASSPFTSSGVDSLNLFFRACFNVSSSSPVPTASLVLSVWPVHKTMWPFCVCKYGHGKMRFFY